MYQVNADYIMKQLNLWAGWSEALLVAHTTLLEILCHDSNTVSIDYHTLLICLAQPLAKALIYFCI